MDFDLTREHRDIQKAAREFARGEFPKVALECDVNEKVPFEIIKKARRLGLIGGILFGLKRFLARLFDFLCRRGHRQDVRIRQRVIRIVAAGDQVRVSLRQLVQRQTVLVGRGRLKQLQPQRFLRLPASGFHRVYNSSILGSTHGWRYWARVSQRFASASPAKVLVCGSKRSVRPARHAALPR